MGIRTLCLAGSAAIALATIAPITSAHAQSASDFCPQDITPACLAAIADRMIEAETDATARQRTALRYVGIMLPKAPEHAARLAKTYSANAGWRSLRRVAESFGKAGQTEEAARLLWAAAEARLTNPDPAFKIKDTLLLVEDASDIGKPDLARRIHNATTPHFLWDTEGTAVFITELRVARLMALYGWPEDAQPVLQTAYEKQKTLPQFDQDRGFTLTRMVTALSLTGNDTLLQTVNADISALLAGAAPNVQHQVRRAHVTALVQAGNITAAKAKAAQYGLDFDQTVRHTPFIFLSYESDYYPGISDDTMRRFELMYDAVSSPAIRADFLSTLVRQLIQDKKFDGLDALLTRVTDLKLRSNLVLELMTYHAREQKDAKTAADLYFAEIPSLSSKFPALGTSLKQYPLSLTAQGLLEAGDLERGRKLADVVLDLWRNDKSKRRRLDALLVGALAAAGENERVKMWYEAVDNAQHKLEVLVWSVRRQVQAGLFDETDAALARIEDLILQISDAKRVPPSYWPEGRPYPTLREDARIQVLRLHIDIVRALAEQDRLPEAKAALAPLAESPEYPMRAHLAIAAATARAGDTEAANDIKREILDLMLSGTIKATDLPYVINAMHP